MSIVIRDITAADADICGDICYAAFEHLTNHHNFASDFPDAETARAMISGFVANPGIYGVVAEVDGEIVGSNFLDERSPIVGLGPITVTPGTQDRQAGRQLMSTMLDRAQEKGYPGIRLVQSAFNNRSLSLYTKLGFDLQVPLAVMQGDAISASIPGYEVRSATLDDVLVCNELCKKIHGHHRAGELTDAIAQQWATVVEFHGEIVGYSTVMGFMGHSVAESNNAMKALICHAEQYPGPGILVPATNHELFRWCLENGLRVVQVMNLMSQGLYNPPKGAFLASVMF